MDGATSASIVTHASASSRMSRYLGVLRVCIGGIFLLAGFQKAGRPYTTAQVILDYEIVGPALSMAFGIMLPWFEIAVGVALLVGPAALLAAAALSWTFLLAQLSVVVRGIETECGCLSMGSSAAADSTVGVVSIVRAGIICVVTLALWRTHVRTSR